MVLQERPSVIVILTPTADAFGRMHCNQFWPSSNQQEKVYFYGRLKVKAKNVRSHSLNNERSKVEKTTEGVEVVDAEVTFLPRDPNQQTMSGMASCAMPLPNTKPEVFNVCSIHPAGIANLFHS